MQVAILSAKRTPVGGLLGDLSDVTASKLGSVAIESAVDDSGLLSEDVQEVIMGNVLSAGLGQAPARQAALGAKLLDSVSCSVVNKVCGSGMKAISNACASIQVDQANVVVAGGMESMSLAPFLLPSMRLGRKFGSVQSLDHMQLDGLQDANQGTPMGDFAEICAEKYEFDRESQDLFATESLKRAQVAANKGLFSREICGVTVKQKKSEIEIILDEQPLKGDVSKIPTLRPAFKKNGTVTAANASSISDGAAALVLASKKTVQSRMLKPMAWIKGISEFSQASRWFTLSPIHAVNALLVKLGWNTSEVGLWEVNEAFAVVTMATMRELSVPHEKINIRGGACALGHPIGASGARIIVTLLHAMQDNNCSKGVAAVCIGGGEAMAIALEIDN